MRGTEVRPGLVAILLLLAVAPLGAQVGVESVVADRYPRAYEIDVLHYGLWIDLGNGSSNEIDARARVLFEALNDGVTEIALDLTDSMRIEGVMIDGERGEFRRDRGRVRIDVGSMTRGQRAEILVSYSGAPADGLIVGATTHGGFSAFADNWADRAHHWFPSIDHPSDKATVAFEIVAPASVEVVANGVLERVEPTPDGRRRWHWVESSEIPTYGMVIGATDFAITTAGTVGGIEVTHWTFAPDSAAGEAAFSRSVEILSLYDSLFGPYPYDKLAHVQSATKFGGMENPSAIFYSEDGIATATAGDALTGLVAHETVHQWFGDAVTEADWNHLWLSEGFATYFAAVFFELRGGEQGRGPAELSRRMAASRSQVVDFFHQTGQAIYEPGLGPGEYEGLLNPNNYPKGAWVLHMLRRKIGDDAFFDAVRDYYAVFRDGIAWTSDFERVVERASGRELSWFFEQWIARSGHPVLRTEWSGGGDEPFVLDLEQVQAGEPFQILVDVELRWPGGSRRETVEIGERTETLRWEIPAPVTEVIVDPDVWLLHEAVETVGSGT